MPTPPRSTRPSSTWFIPKTLLKSITSSRSRSWRQTSTASAGLRIRLDAWSSPCKILSWRTLMRNASTITRCSSSSKIRSKSRQSRRSIRTSTRSCPSHPTTCPKQATSGQTCPLKSRTQRRITAKPTYKSMFRKAKHIVSSQGRSNSAQQTNIKGWSTRLFSPRSQWGLPART